MAQTNIEQIQETLASRGRRDVREAAVWQCLVTLAPEDSHHMVPYREKLERLADVIAQELQSLEGTEHGAL
jgi:hypothetical protein